MKTINKRLDEKGILINIYTSVGYYALGGDKEHWENEFNYWIKEIQGYSSSIAKDLKLEFNKLKNKLKE